MRLPLPMFRAGMLTATLWLLLGAAAFAAPALLPVGAFLQHAQRQAETEAQRVEIRRALADLLHRPPAQLKRIRYADYTGRRGAWTAPELLSHYFVSDPPGVLDTRFFYRDVRRPPARRAIREQLSSVEDALRRRAPSY